MAGFNFLAGMDPNSLPALLRQQLAPQGLAQGPIQAPQLQSGFRAPPAVGMSAMPSMGGMAMPQPQPGFNVQDGVNMLSAGLAGFKKPGAGLNPNGMPEDANLGNSVAAINALQPQADGTFAPPTMPTDIGSGQGGGGPFGFLGSIPDFLKRWSPGSSSGGLPGGGGVMGVDYG